MAAEPMRLWCALALVVALAAGLAMEDSLHHRNFEMAVGGQMCAERDWNPAPRHDEPNDFRMVANFSLDFYMEFYAGSLDKQFWSESCGTELFNEDFMWSPTWTTLT